MKTENRVPLEKMAAEDVAFTLIPDVDTNGQVIENQFILMFFNPNGQDGMKPYRVDVLNEKHTIGSELKYVLTLKIQKNG